MKSSDNPFSKKGKTTGAFSKENTGRYNRTSVEFDEIKFDSTTEANRYKFLKEKEADGLIKNLKLQIEYHLDIWMKKNGKWSKTPVKRIDRRHHKRPGLRYIADFQYNLTKDNRLVVEDVKGVITREFAIKRALFETLFDLELKVIKKAKDWSWS